MGIGRSLVCGNMKLVTYVQCLGASLHDDIIDLVCADGEGGLIRHRWCVLLGGSGNGGGGRGRAGRSCG